MQTDTPAFLLAKFDHLNEVTAKEIRTPSEMHCGQNLKTCSPWQIEFVVTKAADASQKSKKTRAF
jgi:hypothetical protein